MIIYNNLNLERACLTFKGQSRTVVYLKNSLKEQFVALSFVINIQVMILTSPSKTSRPPLCVQERLTGLSPSSNFLEGAVITNLLPLLPKTYKNLNYYYKLNRIPKMVCINININANQI